MYVFYLFSLFPKGYVSLRDISFTLCISKGVLKKIDMKSEHLQGNILSVKLQQALGEVSGKWQELLASRAEDSIQAAIVVLVTRNVQLGFLSNRQNVNSKTVNNIL